MGSCSRWPFENQLFSFRIMHLSSIPSKLLLVSRAGSFLLLKYAKVWMYYTSFTHVHWLKGFWLMSHLGLVQITLQAWLCTGFCVDIARNFSRVNATACCWVVWLLHNDTLKKPLPNYFLEWPSHFPLVLATWRHLILSLLFVKTDRCAVASHCLRVGAFFTAGSWRLNLFSCVCWPFMLSLPFRAVWFLEFFV